MRLAHAPRFSFKQQIGDVLPKHSSHIRNRKKQNKSDNILAPPATLGLEPPHAAFGPCTIRTRRQLLDHRKKMTEEEVT
jgi:hypothetical protein